MDQPGAAHRRRLIPDSEIAAAAGDMLARTCFPPAGSTIDCAVSGGADSLTLLGLAVLAGCKATAIHVDHGLRAGSADEAAVVAEAAERFGADFRSLRVDVEAGSNLEARAREARYRVLPSPVATGHTADDRAETILLNLMRGAGPDGLGAMRPGPHRPILGLRRRETAAFCEALGLTVVQDPSNTDPAFRRNRVRHELLPLIAEISERDPMPVLVRQGELFAELGDDLAGMAGAIDPTDARALREAPPSVARTAIRLWLFGAGVGDGHPVPADSVERILSVARGEARATEVAGGHRVSRSAGRLTVSARQH